MMDLFLICLLSSILFHIAASFEGCLTMGSRPGDSGQMNRLYCTECEDDYILVNVSGRCISKPTTTILPYETDKMCISGSSMEILNGDYEWNSWDDDIEGSKYYKSSYNKYLYPYIASDGSYKYYINSDGYGTMVNAYCSNNNPPSNYVFNVEDCSRNWYISTEDGGFAEDLNMISTNCQEICISGDYRDNLDGAYIWHHFNPTTSSSVYQCKSCQSYLFLWQFSDGLKWRIGPDYSDPGAWSSCHLDEINGIYHPELCDSSNWHSAYDDIWNVNTMSVEKCDITTTTTNPTTTTKKAISYDYYDDDSDDSEINFMAVAIGLWAVLVVLLLILRSICAKKKHDEPVAIYNHNTNQTQKEPATVHPDQTQSKHGQTEGFSNIQCESLDINNIDVDIKGNDIAQNEIVKTVVEKVVDEVAGKFVNAVVEVVPEQAAEVVIIYKR